MDICYIKDCDSAVRSVGLCAIHYGRKLRTGDPLKTVRATPDMSLLERIQKTGWEDANSGCWLWEGRLDHFGYPMIKFAGRQTRVHRAMWEIANGKPIPSGLYALHSCDTPRCMNPEHIEVGDQSVNMQHMKDRGRQTRAQNSHLTEKDVREIRARVLLGESQKSLCSEFGVDSGSMSKLVNRKLFKWVD